jgi:pimeloyl-ACP methyl ester carboxylesterase
MELEDRFATVDGVRLHYVEAGEGPLVVLLHGFPEFWWSWRHQIPALVAAGYRVVAPDWGAAVAWMVATLHPERVRRLAILNVPHPDVMQRTLQRSPRQLLHSWYMFFFQIPWLPEHLMGWGGRRTLEGAYRDARPGAFTAADYARYEEALAGPEGFRGPINWYRAALRRSPRAMRALYRPIPAPVLVIWGEQDRFLAKEMADPDPRWVPDARVVRLPAASHWVQHDEPERVNALLTDFFSAA